MAALVIALDEVGVLPKSRYRDVLHRLWLEMPEHEAVGDAGAVLERVLDLVETSNASPHPSDDADRKREIPTSSARSSHDEPTAEPAPAATKAPMNAFFRRRRFLLST